MITSSTSFNGFVSFSHGEHVSLPPSVSVAGSVIRDKKSYLFNFEYYLPVQSPLATQPGQECGEARSDNARK